MKQFYFFLVCLLASISMNAQENEMVTIKLDNAGTLPDKISDSEKYTITSLKVIGDINGTDLRMIREMAGYSRDGKLATLDLSEANIVSGGGHYLETANDVLGDNAFSGCSSLTNIILPPSITSIGSGAFFACSRLTSITFPSSLTSIGYAAFQRCSSLTSIDLPSGITAVGSATFMGCYSLSNVTLPSSLISIGDYAFTGCNSLKNIALPSNLTSIGVSAFSGCNSLTNIVLPSSLVSIGFGAFAGCNSLTNIALPSSLTDIGESAFRECSSLTSINLPSGITTIGYGTFGGCSALSRVDIPSSVISMADYVFYGCSNLNSVYVAWKQPLSIQSSVFEGVDKQKCVLYVPTDTYSTYQTTEVWGDFDNIVEYDVTGINHVKTSSEITPVARYSINGSKLETPVKGLNIVRYSDGSIRKEIQK